MQDHTLSALNADLKHCPFIDQYRLKKRLRNLNKINDETKRNQAINEIAGAIDTSRQSVERKLERKLNIQYPSGLPISEAAPELVEAITNNQVVIVAGETGSGKTTQLPKICIEAGLGVKGLIGHTQPRRLAARTVSNRIAEELGVQVGDVVGYQVRFTDQVSDASRIKLMTDGILLSEIKSDRFLNRYDAIIIDEAHERSLNIDFLLGYLKQLLPRRPELKVIITSATIDVERFSKHFNDAPVFKVSGRTFPVDVFYRPAFSGDEDSSLNEQVASALEEIEVEERARSWPVGDVLVFLPGEREIRELSTYLRHMDMRNTEVLPLYARLSNQDQNRVFQQHSGRRVVLSTNVAETSITVPGIRYVVDGGMVRMSRYSYRSKIQRLPIEAISQASANQRMGRCGRVAEGICYRLYSEEDFVGRPEFTDPEILRTNLAAVILKMLDSNLGDVYQFPFIDPPDKRLWNDGYKLLFELGAVDSQHKLTPMGRQIASIPTDPRLARMMIQGAEENCINEVLVIVSALTIQDPRDRPSDKQQAADQAHASFKDSDSDFVSFLNLWKAYEEQRQELSSSQLKRYCKKNFLSFMRMREWRDIHRQISLVLDGLKLPRNKQEASYESLHRSLLTGLLGNVGRHDEKREYIGCRNRRFNIFPGSALTKSKPKWLVSAELVETQQVYARCNAKVDPQWIEPLAKHLVKKSWSEPRWEKKRSQVVAYEKVTLYGLEIVSKRRVNYGVIDPVVSREIFIRSGLVEALYEAKKCGEIRENRQLIEDLESIEDRTRRRDIVVDENTIYELYDSRLPSHIVSGASFEKWYRGLGADQKSDLSFTKEQLSNQQAESFDPALYPEHLENNGIRFPLSYQFNPGAESDGVNISVPLNAARQITAGRLERLVPGMLRDKCIALIKNLPRTLRKHFVPVPDVVDAILPKVTASQEDLIDALSDELRKKTGIKIPIESWDLSHIDPHLRINVQILDDNGRVLQQGRDLVEVVNKVEHLIDDSVVQEEVNDTEVKALTDWSFGVLKEEEITQQAGIDMKMYPALKDCKSHVELIKCSNDLLAQRLTVRGLARLMSYRLNGVVAMFPKALPNYKQLALFYAPVGQAKQFYDDFMLGAIINHFSLDEKSVRSEEDFDALLEQGRGDFLESAIEWANLVHEIMATYHKLSKQIKGKLNLAVALPMADLQNQISHLVYDGFLSETPIGRLRSYPRYLEAGVIRQDKMMRDMANERKYVPLFKDWWQQYEDRKKALELQAVWDQELEVFRWSMEELRVSWYAQQLGTSETISEKRLNKQWDKVRRV